MKTEAKRIEDQSPEGNSCFWLGVVRAVWTLFGPLLLTGSILYKLRGHKGWVSRGDAFITIIVVMMIGCRWLEQCSPGAKTAYGDPSTPAHFQRYILILILGTGVAWALANVVGNYLLS